MKRLLVGCLLAISLNVSIDSGQSRRKQTRSTSGSTSARPSESDGRTFLDKRIKELEVGYTLVTFKKTNGKTEDIDGTKGYLMEFEAVVRCTKVNHSPGQMILVGNFNIACDEVGEKHTLEGEMRFEKMERGWRVLKDYPYTKVSERP